MDQERLFMMFNINKKIKNNNITFIKCFDVPDEFYPKPSSTVIPEWYVNTESYSGKSKKPTGDGHTTATIKKCMPIFDSLTAGYIITTYCDLYISRNKNDAPGSFNIEYSGFNPLQQHPFVQAELYPFAVKNLPHPKIMSPWGIKTPTGYSTLFVQPFHRESEISILPGVVDTDKYHVPVNFPFYFNNPEFEGLIPAGTPVVQVIPFKRESWKLKMGNDKDRSFIKKQQNITESRFFDVYKNNNRSNKFYK
jgi:hypothetical protein